MLSAALVFEPGAGRGLEQAHDIFRREDTRQLPRIVRARQLVDQIGPAERDGEEKAQGRRLAVHLGRLRTPFGLMQLEAPEIIGGRGVGRASEEQGQRLDMADIVVLGLIAE